MTDGFDLHQLCEPLAPFLGTWRGRGEGHYPTIEDFPYTEELGFAHVGKPFVTMTQKSRHGVTGEPSHTETGYLRPQGDSRVELVLAQPSGILELDLGTITVTDDSVLIDVESRDVLGTPSAKSVTAVRRTLRVSGATLTSELWMAAVGEDELLHHVRSELSRVD